MHYHPRQTSVQCTDVYKSLPTVHFGFVRFTVEPECQFTPDLVSRFTLLTWTVDSALWLSRSFAA